MQVNSQNNGESGWYAGVLQKDSDAYGDDGFRLTDSMRSADLEYSDFLEDVWQDFHTQDRDILLNGTLDVEERLTGGFNYSLGDVDEAAIVLVDDYDGWQIGFSGNDLIFTNEYASREYRSDDLDGLEENLGGWVESDRKDVLVETVDELGFSMDNWPWKA